MVLVKPNPEKPDEMLQSICVNVWLIVASVCVMVLPNPFVRLFVAVWLAAIPDGMAISIAMQKPRAITTNAALILRLERFLNALDNMPIVGHLLKICVVF